jgi:hypothetical protein
MPVIEDQITKPSAVQRLIMPMIEAQCASKWYLTITGISTM